MAEFSLRRARETDSAAIRKLIHRAGINPTGLNWQRFVVAVNERGELIGCGQIKPHGEEVLELASIAVEPAYRGQGAAREIIEYLLAENPRPLYLTCRSSLGPFYEKFGFESIGSEEMPRYFRRLAQLAGLADALALFDESLLVMKLK